MTCSELIDLVFKGAIAFATLAGGLAAWRGVNTWRKQLVGQDEYDLAKRLTKNAIELERAIRNIRLPWHDPQLTWPEFEKICDEMDIANLEAEVHWGDLLAEEKKEIVECTNQLRLHKDLLETLSTVQDTPQTEEIRKEANAILWTTGIHQRDDFANKVHDAVAALKQKLLPHLKK